MSSFNRNVITNRFSNDIFRHVISQSYCNYENVPESLLVCAARYGEVGTAAGGGFSVEGIHRSTRDFSGTE